MLPDAGAAALRMLPPETAHVATLRLLRLAGPLLAPAAQDDPILAVRALGLSFPNPIGLAAGFDKDAMVPDAMAKLGFGFVECGTVTPRPQSGNPRPRLFRLPEDRAVINRMGFNNEGMEDLAQRLARRARNGIRGLNIGANKDSAGSHRRLRTRVCAAVALCRLRHGQHLLAQHAGPARASGSWTIAAFVAGGHARARAIENADPAQDRARSRRRGDRGDCRRSF